MASKKGRSHRNCCKNRGVLNNRAQFAALNYPSNHNGGSDDKNRIQNPDKKEEHKMVKNPKKGRKGWWFRIRPDTPTDLLNLLDGAGNPRGPIERCTEVQPKTSGNPKDWPGPKAQIDPKNPKYYYRLVCFNAASLKRLNGMQCGFTWSVQLKGLNTSKASGWMPLRVILPPGDKYSHFRTKVRSTLSNWNCCIKKYAAWGRKLTNRETPYTFRSLDQVLNEFSGLDTHPEKFRRYFRNVSGKTGDIMKDAVAELAKCASELENTRKKLEKELEAYSKAHDDNERHKVVALIEQAQKQVKKTRKDFRKKLRHAFGITPNCVNRNRLTDYLPKPDWDDGNEDYTYLNTNVSIRTGKNKNPTMAPIALDVFPAGFAFYRLKFKKDNKAVLGSLYKVPQAGKGKHIGYVIWYYGYCEVPGAKPQRSYGWVPALALESS